VGIGASAGGLEALKRFFSAVPAESGLSYVVVVHLPAEGESHLPDLLQPHAPIPVLQVTELTPLERDRAYVIPPGRNLSAVDSYLRLSPLEEQRQQRAPIDHFFRTLADAYDGHSVAVILTGTGSDGALGVRAIRENGGLVVVQDPDEAEFDGMPRSALATGGVDLVLPVDEMPRRILDFERTHPHVEEEAGRAMAEARDPMPRVLAQVRARTGQDFSRYKGSTIQRRIERRMQLQGVEELPAYLELLRESPREAAALAEDLLVHVTSFFRDRAVFEHLEREVVPKLFEGKGPGSQVRVWSVGCATGEEAYSLAILLLEEAARRESPPEIQIFASDLHERSLHFAREGLYPETIAADVSPERLSRYFHKEDGGYRVRTELRERVVFAPHNLLRDPPFSHLDLVCCRNLLIYLQRDVQGEVIELFHYALHGEGYLVLGTAETLDRSELFRTESKEHHVYRKRSVAPSGLRLPRLPLSAPVPAFPAQPAPRGGVGAGEGAAVAYGALHERMVERYAPPSVLVGPDHTVLHVSEHAGRFLQLSGVPSHNVLELVREELRGELRAALYLARDRRTPSRSRPIAVRLDGATRQVVVRVSPAGAGDTEGLYLVMFDEMGEVSSADGGAEEPATSVRELETELDATRGRLQALVEEFETGQEEMRASNEELQSANEELRSTLEELETSKEELQSTNEELQTVNHENRHKLEDLSQLSRDLQNLLKTTYVATLFLDRSFRILRFTPKVGELFNVRHTDRGRPLADLTNRLGYGGLLEDAKRVLETLVPVEREVGSEDGRWHLIRVLPYRTVEDRIEGVVITLVDVTRLKRSEAAVRESEERYRALFNEMDEAYAVVEVIPDEGGRWSDFRFVEVNPAFVKHTGMPYPVGQTATELLGTPNPRWAEIYGQVAETGEPVRFEETEPTLGRVFDLDVFRLGGEGSRRVAVLFTDVTERKHAEEALRGSERRYRLLFENMIEGFALAEMIWDEGGNPVDWRYLEVNRAWEQTGVPVSAAVGRTAREVNPELEPYWLETYGRVVRTGEPVEYENYASGFGKWFETFAFKHSDNCFALLFRDVTERRHAEAARKETEERFRLFGEASSDVLWIRGAETLQWEYLSPAFETIYGYERSRVMGNDDLQHWAELIVPEDREHALAAMERVRAGERVSFEYRVRRADGEVRWLRNTDFPIRDAEGRVRHIGGIGQDITEEKRAAAALRASEERQAFLLRLSDALRPLDDPAAVQNTAARVLGEHLGATRAMYAEIEGEPGGETGILRGQYLGPDAATLAAFPERYAYRDYGEHVMALRRRGEAMVVTDIATDPAFSATERAVWAAGGMRAAITVALVKQGRMVADFGVQSAVPRAWTADEVDLVRETAERTWAAVERARAEAALRVSEARMQRALSAETVGVLFFRLDGRIVDANATFERLSGYPAEELRGIRHWEVLTPPEYMEATLRTAAALAEHGRAAPYEKQFIRKDGSRWWGLFAPTRLSGEGPDSECVEFIIDISDRKRAEAALRELNQTLEQRVVERTSDLVAAQEARRQVLRQLATAEEEERRRISRELHDEMGQHLTGLLLGLRAAQREAGAPELAEKLGGLERLASETARDIQSMAVELRPPALDSLGLTAAVQSHLEDWSARHGIEHDFHARGLAGVRLSPEVETTIYRVVQEGLTNILKHAEATRVSLVLERHDGMARVILEDDGRGFDVDETLARPEKAQRLGVRGMRERVALLGGELEIESSPGAGTTLYARIPVPDTEDARG
jgi:two-component system CheB/CheR fusion protein